MDGSAWPGLSLSPAQPRLAQQPKALFTAPGFSQTNILLTISPIPPPPEKLYNSLPLLV